MIGILLGIVIVVLAHVLDWYVNRNEERLPYGDVAAIFLAGAIAMWSAMIILDVVIK